MYNSAAAPAPPHSCADRRRGESCRRAARGAGEACTERTGPVTVTVTSQPQLTVTGQAQLTPLKMAQVSALLLLCTALCVRGYSVRAPEAFVSGPDSATLEMTAADPEESDKSSWSQWRPKSYTAALQPASQPSVVRVFGDRALKLDVLRASSATQWHQHGLPTAASVRPAGPEPPNSKPIQHRSGLKERKGGKGRKGRKGRKGVGRKGRKERKNRKGQKEENWNYEANVVKTGSRRVSATYPGNWRGANRKYQRVDEPAAREVSSNSLASRRPHPQRRNLGARRRRVCRRLRLRGLKTLPRLPARLVRACERLWASQASQARSQPIPPGHTYVGPQVSRQPIPPGHMYVGPPHLRPSERSW